MICSIRRMSMRSLPRPRIIASRSAARPLDGVDHWGRPQRGNDRRQMLYVGDLDVDHDFEKVRRTVGDLQVADIAALLSDDCGQAAEIAWFVCDRDVEAADVNGVVVIAPGDIEPPLGRLGKALESL